MMLCLTLMPILSTNILALIHILAITIENTSYMYIKTGPFSYLRYLAIHFGSFQLKFYSMINHGTFFIKLMGTVTEDRCSRTVSAPNGSYIKCTERYHKIGLIACYWKVRELRKIWVQFFHRLLEISFKFWDDKMVQ